MVVHYQDGLLLLSEVSGDAYVGTVYTNDAVTMEDQERN